MLTDMAKRKPVNGTHTASTSAPGSPERLAEYAERARLQEPVKREEDPGDPDDEARLAIGILSRKPNGMLVISRKIVIGNWSPGLAGNLTMARKRMNLSRKKLARKVGIEESVLTQIERGVHDEMNRTVRRLQSLAQALKVTVAQLVGY
jgi:DNA-binding XRE family transcriptional regulator